MSTTRSTTELVIAGFMLTTCLLLGIIWSTKEDQGRYRLCSALNNSYQSINDCFEE